MSPTETNVDPDTTPDGGSAEAAPPVRKDLWWEVAAVLAVVVVPWLAGGMLDVAETQSYRPWALSRLLYDAAVCYVVLYLIHRSGDGWAAFGLTRPRGSDVLLGLFLACAAGVLGRAYGRFGLPVNPDLDGYFPHSQGAGEQALMVVSFAVSGFLEELVTRGYLIPRLEQLLGSGLKAVLVSAVVFASYHAYQGAAGLLHTFFLGLLFGTAFLVLRRLWPLALAHAAYNILLELTRPS
jgi:membrane protease YdiL (CAAX protease family)